MNNNNLTVMAIILLMFALTFNAAARRDPAPASPFSSRRSDSRSDVMPSMSGGSRSYPAPASSQMSRPSPAANSAPTPITEPVTRPAPVTRSAPAQRPETVTRPAPVTRSAPAQRPEPSTVFTPPAPPFTTRADPEPARNLTRAAPAMPSRSDLPLPATTRVVPAAPTRERHDARPAAEPYASPLRTASPTRSAPSASRQPPINDAISSPGSIRPESGVSRLTFGSSRDTRGLADGRTTTALSLRSPDSRSSAGSMRFDKSPPMSVSRPYRSYGTPRLTTASLPRARPPASGFGRSRHTDGRSTLYRPPARAHYAGSRPYRAPSHSHHRPYHRSDRQPYRFNPWTFSYQHYGFTPFWYPAPCFNPYYYPYSYPYSGFGLSWFSGSFGLSFFSCAPAYSTCYYDSWHCGGWGYSRIYHDCWRSGWYGGISYIYNPWPVYRTVYLYDTAPAVINAETVYVTEPSTVVYNTAQPASQTSVAAPAPAVCDSAPVEERAETLATRCFCRCGCNGQRPCVCEYPCGSEYAWQPEDFDLSLDYASYSETLDPETIWLSYANLDYLEADPRVFDRAATAFSR